jgi:hypothetical protein
VARKLRRRKGVTTLAAALFVSVAIAAFWWVSASAARAEVGRERARMLFREALLTEHGDATIGAHGVPPARYRRRAIEGLLEARHLDRGLHEATLHAAVLLSEIGEHDRSLELLAELAEHGGSHPGVAWATAHARMHGTEDSFVGTQEIASDAAPVEFFYRARTLLGRRDRADECSTLLGRLTCDPLFGTVALHMQGIHHNLAGSREPLGALLKLYASAQQAPLHPVVLWNLATAVFKAQSVFGDERRSRLSELEAMLRRALAEGDDAKLWGALGLVRHHLGGSWRETRPLFQAAYDRDFVSSHIKNLASSFVDEAKATIANEREAGTAALSRAAQLYRDALVADDADPLAIAGLANCCFGLEEDEEAELYARKAAASSDPRAAAAGQEILTRLGK